jgi:transglutaminase-like putative cysteine protease
MHLDATCRLSRQLTLTLACLCLGYAELPLLPGISVFVALVLLLLVVAFVLEPRWSMPIWLANVLGLAIAVGWGVWLVYRLLDGTDAFLSLIPLPAAVMPYVGPLLLLLLLVKLFRPQQARDFWLLQGIGLLQVALACVLTMDLVFVGLVLAYLACALWCLTRFHLQSSSTVDSDSSIRNLPRSPLLVSLTSLLVAAVPAVLLFLILPRVGQGNWEPFAMIGGGRGFNASIQTGAAEQIDLNRTGTVEVNEEVALTVTATDARGEPKLDLPAEQRWRGAMLDYYLEGCWRSGYQTPLTTFPPQDSGSVLPLMGPAGPVVRRPPGQFGEERLLDLGPRQYFLTFQFQPRQAGGLFLADPVIQVPPSPTRDREGDPPPQTNGAPRPLAGQVPVLSLRPGPYLFYRFQGTLIPNSQWGRGEALYRQVTVPTEDPDLTPARDLVEGYLVYLCYPPPIPRLRQRTEQILQEILARPEYHLTAADLDWQPYPGFPQPAMPAAFPVAGRGMPPGPMRFLKPRCWEKVARALTRYLATSGEYTYTLELRHDDPDLDPTVDFLCNVKQGHCERYAGGLALLLRSLGIPSRVVMGFRGQESQEDGTYLVRHSLAHSWVEALAIRPTVVPGRPAVVKDEHSREWPRYWLSLDPTPAGEAPPPPPFSLTRFWENCRQAGWSFWRELILDYSADRQQGLLEDLWEKLVPSRGQPDRGWRRWLAVGELVLLAWLSLLVMRRCRWRLRARRREASARGQVVPFYGRLLAILARGCGLRPRPAQTPREFAAAVQGHLSAAVGAVLAELPVRLAALLYRVRYGNGALTEEERRAIEEQLDQLESALRAGGASGKTVENRPVPA